METMKPKQIEEVLQPKFEAKTATIRGWVYRKRTMKGKVFLVIRDSTDIIQVVINENSKAWEAAQKITMESSCYITGKVRKDGRAPTGYEMDATKIEIVGLADTFPIARDLSEDFLLSVRHLSIRSQKITAALKIRSTVTEAIHEFYRREGYFEVQSPTFTVAACEGGSTLFPVDYFGKKVYLSQSWQLYAEAMIQALEKCYCIAPSFRAEKSRTTRHVTEFWHHEMEAAWMDFDEMLKVQERCVAYICQKVAKDRAKELKIFDRDPKYFASIKAPFKRLTYTKALELLAKKGVKLKWGADLGTKEEKILSMEVKKPFFIVDYPVAAKAFYVKQSKKDSKVALSADMMLPEGYGEVTTGGQREEDIKVIMERLKRDKLNPKDFQWYLDLRKFGTVDHSGYGLGVGRLVRWICKVDHIRDVIPFPRTMNRFYP